jgi:transcriptional regulator with XRE-family HTH domain
VEEIIVVSGRTLRGRTALRSFGANIRRERVLRLVSQAKLAKLAGLNVRTIARIEAGELGVRSNTVERIARALGCTLAKLCQ